MAVIITKIFICISLYFISAYATTDILRLLKGSDITVQNKDCFCESCGSKIALYEQIPIFSFLLSRGKCRHCGAPISPGNFILEVLLTAVFYITVAVFHFSALSLIFCILFYELIKLVCILRWGKRGKILFKELLFSLLGNLVIFSLLGIFFFYHFAVSTF